MTGVGLAIPGVYFYHRQDIYKLQKENVGLTSQRLKNDADYKLTLSENDFNKNQAQLEAHAYEDFLNKSGITIFSLSYCGHCNLMRKLFDEMGVSYKSIECDNVENLPVEARDNLMEVTESRMFPKLFIGKTFYQGYTETLQRKKSGELQNILDQNNIAYKN